MTRTCRTCVYYNMEHGTTYDTELEYDTNPQASFCGLHGRMHIPDPDNPPAQTHFASGSDVHCGWFGRQQMADNNIKQLSLF